jgi:hypothetical protein
MKDTRDLVYGTSQAINGNMEHVSPNLIGEHDTYIYIYIDIRICMYIYTYICIYVHICMYIYAHHI